MKQSAAYTRKSSTRTLGLYVMAVAYVLAGVNHFLHLGMYLRIIPAFIPFPKTANIIVGLAEIVLGTLVLFDRSRNVAAWGIITLLLLVFPANIKMAYDYTSQQNPSAWITWLRLPLQGILIWWAYLYTARYHQQRLV